MRHEHERKPHRYLFWQVSSASPAQEKVHVFACCGRSCFEDGLGWEDGVHFQFLATQNTMAALIGGKTVHSWGCIPVNIQTALDKSS